jgi:hypothetical protein
MRPVPILAVALLLALPARAGVPAWLAGHWAITLQPCEIAAPDGPRPAGLEFLAERVLLHPPMGFENLVLPTKSLAAHYAEPADGASITIRFPASQALTMTFTRQPDGLLRDEAGYLYRHCDGLVS